MRYLDLELHKYSKTDFYPFHMPGHKRQMPAEHMEDPYQLDITEITDFDQLYRAEGILKENQDLAARLYGADHSYFLVNGSTAGLLTAVSASVSRGGKLLMARNCHKAVYHGAYLRGLETAYVFPSYDEVCGMNGGISPVDVEDALKADSGIQAVLLTSPDYTGVVSDVKAIAEIAHRYGVPLIVDEAHGAHLHFAEQLPVSALDLGADLVIHSLHKTLPAFTQTALLHIKSSLVKKEEVEKFLDIYQTSSPSYVFMGGISRCLRFLEEEGKEKFDEFCRNLQECREQLKDLKILHLAGEEIRGQKNIFDYDDSKIIISTVGAGLTGPMFHQLLRERYHLEMEMEAEHYVLALTSVMDTREGFQRLVQAVRELDEELAVKMGQKAASARCHFTDTCILRKVDQALPIWKAMEGKRRFISFAESEGKISTEYAYLYPPGIPFLLPGERISQEILEQMKSWQEQGLEISGIQRFREGKIGITEGQE